jgi:threonine synthase
MAWEGIIKQYSSYLPVSDKTPIVTLKEGNTPLIPADSISRHIGKGLKIFLKYEGLNPTGSFKDRGMTLAISKALEEKSQAVMCASTGNTSASAAAYSARSGLKCFVLIPHNSIAMGKLAQAVVHGAKVLAIRGNFDDTLEIVKKVTEQFKITLVNSLNPYRIEGQKTGSFEIVDVLGEAPAFHAIPVGNAGNITAYWKGYKEYYKEGKIKSLPRMIGFQAEGSAPIVKGAPVKDPKTLATAIKIGNPASWKSAVEASQQSGGMIQAVTDDEIIEAYKLLAQLEGVFVEPASAASLAGVIKYSKLGYFDDSKGKTVVCILTGHGLKDPDRAIKTCTEPEVVENDANAVVERLGLKK